MDKWEDLGSVKWRKLGARLFADRCKAKVSSYFARLSQDDRLWR